MPLREPTEIDHQERIARVLRHLEENLDEPLTVDTLARKAAYAKHHFHRVFRGVTGESLVAHLRRLRLERAARRLRHGQASVTDIALEAGYTAPEAFTRAFAQHFGVSPQAYRGEPSPRLQGIDLAAPAPAVEVRVEPAMSALAVRHVGSYAQVGTAFERLVRAAPQGGGAGPALRFYGLCFDDPEVTEEAHLRFDACLPMSPLRGVRPPGLAAVEIPAGTYAVALHRGPYSTLAETYLRLIGGWLPRTRYALLDEPAVEAYLDDPQTTPAADCRTEVRVRIAARR